MTISGVLPYIVFMVAIGAGVVSSFGVNPIISSRFSLIIRSTNVASLNENTTNKASSWNDRLEELKEYRALVGDTLVPKRRPSPLGNWVNKQRQRRKKGKMKGDQIRALDNLGFIWDATNVRKSVKEVWWERFQELKEEIGQSGYASIKSNSSLGYWMNLQRNNYILFSQGKDSVLTPGKIEALNAIEFPWKPRREQLWDMRIQELNAYKAEHGNVIVPITYKNNKLANWVSNQRKHYKMQKAGNSSTLSSERIEQLDRLGFVWNRSEYAFLEITPMYSRTNC